MLALPDLEQNKCQAILRYERKEDMEIPRPRGLICSPIWVSY